MSENFRGKNVFICGYDEDNNINKLKVNKNGEIKISNNISFSDENSVNKNIYHGSNLINCQNLGIDKITNVVNVENYSYCNIFYEDDTISNNNFITVLGILDNYCYYELDTIQLKHMHNCRKGVLFKLNIIGIKELYLQNCSDETFENVIASVYCY